MGAILGAMVAAMVLGLGLQAAVHHDKPKVEVVAPSDSASYIDEDPVKVEGPSASANYSLPIGNPTTSPNEPAWINQADDGTHTGP